MADAEAKPTPDEERVASRLRRRELDKEEWQAYWDVRSFDKTGKILPTARYYFQRTFFDKPVTFIREKLIEPIQDKYRMPYYHRKLTRVPEIDQCGVLDNACQYEAQEQYRLDLLVDQNIITILRDRLARCVRYHTPYLHECGQAMEDYEEAELNFFIKYGELGVRGDAISVLMKQKHRMIWERRHPEIMAERERQFQEHKANFREGDFDYSFWKKGVFWMDKKNMDQPYDFNFSKNALEGDKPLSKNWEYYRRLARDPEFDKEQGKKSEIHYTF